MEQSLDKFPCTGCGLCCQNAKKILYNTNFLKENNLEFPYGFTPSGMCEMYIPYLKKCSVYDNRPLVCDVAKLYEQKIDKKTVMPISKEHFFKINATECNKLIKKAQLDERFLVVI